MSFILAYAENWDPTQVDFILILLCAAGIASTGGLVGLIVLLARRMGHRHAEQIDTAAMFWGLIAAGSIVYAVVTQLAWFKTHNLELMSGYGNPKAVGPPLPWVLWSALAGIYLLLMGWTVWKKN